MLRQVHERRDMLPALMAPAISLCLFRVSKEVLQTYSWLEGPNSASVGHVTFICLSRIRFGVETKPNHHFCAMVAYFRGHNRFFHSMF